MRVLAAQSGYYRWRVLDRKDAPSLTLVRLPRTPQEADTYQQGSFVFENATRWRSVQDEGGNMIWDLVPWIAKVHHPKLANEIDLFRSWLSKTDKVKANVVIPPFRNCFTSSVVRPSLFGEIFIIFTTLGVCLCRLPA